MVYLFIGQDAAAKEIQLQKLKGEYCPRATQEFSVDMLWGKDAALEDIQRFLLCIGLENAKRMLVIRDAARLKEEIKAFLIGYVKKPAPDMVLVIDMELFEAKDAFREAIFPFVRVIRFKQEVRLQVFDLSRAITMVRPAQGLKVLHELIDRGERPERILGGLRSSCERTYTDRRKLSRDLKLLLACDIEIKTGALKPVFALEKLVVRLCDLADAYG